MGSVVDFNHPDPNTDLELRAAEPSPHSDTCDWLGPEAANAGWCGFRGKRQVTSDGGLEVSEGESSLNDHGTSIKRVPSVGTWPSLLVGGSKAHSPGTETS